MELQNPLSLIFLSFLIIIIQFPISIHSSRISQPGSIQTPIHLHPLLSLETSFGGSFDVLTAASSPNNTPATTSGGLWILLQKNIGVSAMHMQLLHNDKVIIFDRTDFGPSNLSLPGSKCRHVQDSVFPDCTAHSILYDLPTNTFRPLMVQTDVWCSSAAVGYDGTLVQTGGYKTGANKIRLFTPCHDDLCDWIELPQNLTSRRWYASDNILPDGRIIIVGGRRAFSYEFFPKNPTITADAGVYWLQFLKDTNDPGEENNLYPFLHLLPDGNLFVFANQRSIVLDYVKNQVVKKFPPIPGEKRSYPASGSSVMLPLRLAGGNGLESPGPEVEIMICGGASGGAYVQAHWGVFVEASKTCGRLRITDLDPQWKMEEMPTNRVMPDMLLLPTGDVLMLNGAGRGTAGWELGDDPVLNPVLYKPNEIDPSKRFSVLDPTVTPRMYHSSAILTPSGGILVGGSNPHQLYRFTGVKYPTDLSLEVFLPPYLAPQYSELRPSILSVEEALDNTLSYGQQFSITFTLSLYHNQGGEGFNVTMIRPSFTTHSFAMNQRLLVLENVGFQQLSLNGFKVTVFAPPTSNVAPPGYYMTFLVNDGIPSTGYWLRIK
ncbi:OLC1v1028058C1 [Oldenlandia corymbosa var. corymbosa]|uniref:OLC1v1028058C1 n=1 Tax=Oldenlandia corymbosa var. corymbosa TaxID=529605 RepID=A0AAV1CC06_OLDCO|nr:OLC1v1028058C1 [Oldenlandia corymbosa var. corymbosa]